MRDLATIRRPVVTLALTVAAMLAFAANSLLCRLALQSGSIDPASFGALRIVAGALALGAIVRLRREKTAAGPDWWSAAMLFAYVACFSFAYVSLPAGTGALVLFGAVQLTMFGAALRKGERFSMPGWLGLSMAAAGLVYLVLPGVVAPPWPGTLLMALAGLSWGVYSLRGRRAAGDTADPLGATARNFMYATPLALALWLPFTRVAHADASGVTLAIVSGALSFGVGYAFWYAALRDLSAMRAATVQLSVPPLAALGAVAWLGESLSPRLVLASAAILGGIALALTKRGG